MLFDDKERTWQAGIPSGMGPFDYLDRSGRQEAAQVRALLEQMLVNFPDTHGAKTLAGRLRSNDEAAHNAAFLELCLHEMFVRRSYRLLAVEVEAPGSTKRPDYLMSSPTGSEFFVEAVVATGQSPAGQAAERRLGAVLDALAGLQHPRFRVAVLAPVAPRESVGAAGLREAVRRWLDGLDPSAVGAVPAVDDDDDDLHAASSGRSVRRFPLADQMLTLRAVPRRAGDVGSSGIEYITHRLRALAPAKAIMNRGLEKAKRYGDRLGRPFYLALSSTQLVQRDEDFEQALFGMLRYSWRLGSGNDIGEEALSVTRERRGIWRQGDGPRYGRLSGVLCFSKLTPWTLSSARARVFENPLAEQPLSLAPLGLPVARVVDDTVQTTPGLTVAELLGLPPGWPQ